MSNRFKKIISSFVLVSLIGFYFVSPFTVKKADAFLGIGDITFNTTMGDIPRFLADTAKKVLEFGFKKLKKRMLTQIQNDLVNWVQGGGEPRFIKDPSKFIKDNTEYATISAIDKFFNEKGVDICSPFKANVQILVNRTKILQEEQMKCSLGDIKDNLKNFADNFETGGGWTTWLKLHETRNTLPGAYLASTQIINAERSLAGNTAQAKISAGKGFLDQKKCSLIAYKVFNLEFDETDGATTIIKSEDMPPDVVTKILDPSFNAWTLLWPEISKNTKIEDVVTATIHLVPTGKTITTPLIPPGDVPPGATCAKEEIITPGSIVGDWVGGGLEKLGIDSLIGANDIASILDAVLDAAVNRAAREGLSYMKSGRGSYTQPFNKSTKNSANIQQIDGLESPNAISLQNQMIDLRNAAEKLKSDTEKLTSNENNLAKFNTRLLDIGGKFDENKNFISGVITKDFRRDGKSANNIAGFIDQLFSSRKNLTDRTDFNKEENNTGVYLANKAINAKISEVWKAIDSSFRNLSTNNSLYSGKKSCIKVDYTLEPKVNSNGIPLLPFFDSDGKAIGWVGNNNYVDNLRGEDGFESSSRISIEEFQSYISGESNGAQFKSEEFLQKSDAYDALIQNTEGVVDALENDLDFVKKTLPEISLYTSILLDYDKAGREFDLVQKVKKYSEALSGTKGSSENDNDLSIAYSELRSAQRLTRNAWLKTQQDILSGGDADQKSRAQSKIFGINSESNKKGIEEAIRLITSSLDEVDKNLITDPATQESVVDPTQLGLNVSSAVSQAMGLDINSVRSEMEERQVKIAQQQTDVSNRLGKFISNKDERISASLDGGDSEWEKYFNNRSKLVYSAFIYDFYEHNFVNRFCDGNPPD